MEVAILKCLRYMNLNILKRLMDASLRCVASGLSRAHSSVPSHEGGMGQRKPFDYKAFQFPVNNEVMFLVPWATGKQKGGPLTQMPFHSLSR